MLLYKDPSYKGFAFWGIGPLRERDSGLSIFSKNNLSPAREECGRDCGQGGVVSAGDPGDAGLHRVAGHPGHLDTEEGHQCDEETC